MRHITRRRHRVRRARLTRRLRQRRQRGGAALTGTESLTKWLRKILNRYMAFGQADNTGRPFADSTRGAELGTIIAEDSQAIKFIDDGSRYTLPLEIQPNVIMPPDKEIDSYDLKGNYGKIIRLQVMELSSAQTGQAVSQMTSTRFSTTVENMLADAGLYPIEQLLKTENILRGLLRADLSSEDSEKENLNLYKHIVEDVRTLNDVNMYPLYVWAVALNFDTENADAGGETNEGDIKPVLIPVTSQAGPAQPAE